MDRGQSSNQTIVSLVGDHYYSARFSYGQIGTGDAHIGLNKSLTQVFARYPDHLANVVLWHLLTGFSGQKFGHLFSRFMYSWG
jgi:hypothetical protein